MEAHLFGISPFGEDSHALPLTSELDALLGGECDPDSVRQSAQNALRRGSGASRPRKKHPYWGARGLRRVDKKDDNLFTRYIIQIFQEIDLFF